MKTIISGLIALGIIIAAGFGTSAYAGDQPNVLIMGEDADKDTIPRNSRVFKRVLAALATELQNEGFAVYDEVGLTLGYSNQGRSRRTDAEIIDIARSVKKVPIDVAVIFSIYPDTEKTSYTWKLRTRIEGRLLDVHGSRQLGNFEVEPAQVDNVPTNIKRDRLIETVGKNAKRLGHDLGAVLALRLAHYSPDIRGEGTGSSGGGMTRKYSLMFEGFTPDDLNKIEEYLVGFKGYKQYRPVSSSSRYANYLYESQSDVARLNRNLRQMLEHMGTQGRIVLSGDTLTTQKIATPKKRN